MLRITIEIDTAKSEPIGTKEALLYTLSAFGEVKVVNCEAIEPQQTAMWKER